jgi:hypothetical protein
MSAQNARRYDFRQEMELLGPIVERAKSAIREEQRITIASACRNRRFAQRVQFIPFCGDEQHVMTMQHLSDLGLNDPGIQRIDPKAVERLLFGDYGLIEHKKLKNPDAVGRIGERPVIVYFQPDADLEPERPANASGRHRNFAWQILAHVCGVTWDDIMAQPMWVDKTIARDKDEYTMMMLLANGSQARRQPPIELKSYDLTRRNVSIEDINHLVATRLAATQGQFGDVIAAGVTMGLSEAHQDQCSFIYDRVKSSWTKTQRISSDHKKRLVEAFKTDGDAIKGLMNVIADHIIDIIDSESERNSAKSLRERINERITDEICRFFELPTQTWQTDADVVRRALENLEVKEKLLRQFVA